MFLWNLEFLHSLAEIGPDGFHDLKFLPERERGDFGKAHRRTLITRMRVIQWEFQIPALSRASFHGDVYSF